MRTDYFERDGDEVEVNFLLPSVSVTLSSGDEFHWQEWEADEFLKPYLEEHHNGVGVAEAICDATVNW